MEKGTSVLAKQGLAQSVQGDFVSFVICSFLTQPQTEICTYYEKYRYHSTQVNLHW